MGSRDPLTGYSCFGGQPNMKIAAIAIDVGFFILSPEHTDEIDIHDIT